MRVGLWTSKYLCSCAKRRISFTQGAVRASKARPQQAAISEARGFSGASTKAASSSQYKLTPVKLFSVELASSAMFSTCTVRPRASHLREAFASYAQSTGGTKHGKVLCAHHAQASGCVEDVSVQLAPLVVWDVGKQGSLLARQLRRGFLRLLCIEVLLEPQCRPVSTCMVSHGGAIHILYMLTLQSQAVL